MSSRESTTKRNGLLALGSAAVIAVYAAGYVRTKSAAAAFANETGVRRPIVAMVLPAAVVAPKPEVPAPATKATMPDSPAAIPDAPFAAKTVVSKKPAEPAAPTADSSTKQAVSVVALAPVPEPTKTTTPPGDTTTAVDSVRRVIYKDGKYLGWGTSRHGDIEAAVEIKDGKITAAYITQCLTRYSCSWISTLPGQVVSRQSPETDYISGATQSTNAFYYAVVQALGLAKAK